MSRTRTGHGPTTERRPPTRPAPFVRTALAGALLELCSFRPAEAQQRPPEAAVAPAATTVDQASLVRLARLDRYVRGSFARLVRSHADLAAAAVDPKCPSPTGRWPVYLAPTEDRASVLATLSEKLAPADLARIDLVTLPPDSGSIRTHGLLYLPHPYVVPGGRFNEMYGWDSYFIVRGLLATGEVALARAMADNHLYQVRHYGTVLNANRTYYLTRSQPPLLAATVLDVYARTGDREWLEAAWPLIEKLWLFWNRPPHRTPATGLSRYFDTGRGPAPEVVAGELDASGKTHYDRILEHFRTRPVDGYDLSLFYDRASDRLTDLFYVADRSMRESGFDPSDRFGTFNLAAMNSNPVCLNSFLYLMELQAARIRRILGDEAGALVWDARARYRRALVDRYLWDEPSGLYQDYDFTRRSRRAYPFLTTFFPLWAGLASPAQAARVAANVPLFEAPGGLVTSLKASGNQWDSPFGWAPLTLLAVEGLRRHGFHEPADRISIRFLSMLLADFSKTGALFEKYDVLARRSGTGEGIRFGYTTNEIGFGWTNAAYLEMMRALPEAGRREVARLGAR